MAQSVSANPVRGMRDFLPEQLRARNAVLARIRNMVAARGFMEIETPAVEDISKLRSKQGGENESMVFEILRRGLDKDTPHMPSDLVDSGLRYDLTLPLSRYYANNHAALPPEVRIFQTGPVWRAERPQKGRFRQFNQCDIDIIGCEGPAAEIEVLSCGLSVLQELGLAPTATLHLNDRRILDALMQTSGIAEDLRAKTLIELDKLDKSTPEAVANSIAQIEGITSESAQTLMNIIEELQGITIQPNSTEVELASCSSTVPLFDVALVISELQVLVPQFRVIFDPSLVRGMGYYTGLIYEVKLDGQSSSVCGGGRYDGMIGRWLGKDVAAVGFSFGFERLIGMIADPTAGQTQTVALGYRTQEDHLAAVRLAQALATQGIPAGLVKTPKKLKAAFFEGLVGSYSRIIMPDSLTLDPQDALDAAKDLTAN